MRRAELLSLVWDQSDFKAKQLRFLGKGDLERIVPLNDKTEQVLCPQPS
ncbi:hypothetical protein [Metallumcola ferriviriculae]